MGKPRRVAELGCLQAPISLHLLQAGGCSDQDREPGTPGGGLPEPTLHSEANMAGRAEAMGAPRAWLPVISSWEGAWPQWALELQPPPRICSDL